MKRFFTFFVGLFVVTLGMAQAPTGVFAKASVAPVIDGVIDDVWTEATAYNIDKAVVGETPTIDIWNSYNLIQNWNFTTDLTGWGNYHDVPLLTQPTAAPVVADGVVVMQVGLATDGQAYHYQHNQSGLMAEPNVPYVLSFKSWASSDAPCVLDFEDTSGNNYNRYGSSTDTESKGRSEWNYTVTNDPKWFVFHVTFDQIVASTVQKIQWMLALSNSTIYLDSVLLVKQTEYDLLANLPTGAKTIASSINKVYPSPVGNGNTLYVELSSAKTNVAIYNAVGQKMMEKVSTGNIAKFDVSSLQKGLYFVKLSDGSTQKFIR